MHTCIENVYEPVHTPSVYSLYSSLCYFLKRLSFASFPLTARAEKVKRQQQGIQSAAPPNSAPSPSASISNGGLLFIPPAQVNNSALENSAPQTRSQTSNFMLPKTETETAYSASAPATNFMPNSQPTLQGAQAHPVASLPRTPIQSVKSPYHPQTSADSGLAFGYNESTAPAMLAAYDSATRDYLNVLKAPLRPAGRTITWTDINESKLSVDDQRKRFKNISKELKSECNLLESDDACNKYRFN